MKVEGLFPIPIGFSKLDNLTQDEIIFVYELDRTFNQGNEISVDHKLLNHPKLSRFKNVVDEAIKEYIETVHCPANQIKHYITQSWANYTKKDQFHHKHCHANSFVSGVLYLQTYNDSIKFFKDRYDQIKVNPETYNIYNSDSWVFNVQEGDIVIFPSSLNHMVDKIESDHERISIAFNVFLSGYLGDDGEMTGLHLEDQS